jgi:surface carbohydrate biosynthesis protein
MEPVDVVLLYEHVARELDVLCAVKYLCETRHRLRVEIVQQPYGVAAALQRFEPRIVALPFCYSDSLTDYPLLLDWPKATYVNLAWEELFYNGNREAKLPKGEFASQHVLHHAWGDFFAELLRERGVPQRNIFVNGQPAFMLYQSPYRDYFPTRLELARKHGLDPARRWIFFPENYNWAFYAPWKLDSFEHDGLRRDHMEAMVRFCRDSLTTALEWCAKLAATQQVEIVIRPRPSVPLEEFQTFAAGVISESPAALHYTKTESVREWILASQVVLSSYSTSLIESAVAGKDTYIVEPYPIPVVLQTDWQAYLFHLTTAEAFETACLQSAPASGGDLNTWTRARLLAHGDPIDRLAQMLSDLRRGGLPRPPHFQPGSVLPSGQSSRLARREFEHLRRAGHTARRTPNPIVSPLYENDFVSRDEIDWRVQRWGQVLGSQVRPPAPTRVLTWGGPR